MECKEGEENEGIKRDGKSFVFENKWRESATNINFCACCQCVYISNMNKINLKLILTLLIENLKHTGSSQHT